MSIFTTTRRVLGPMVTQIKSLSKDSKKYIKTFHPNKGLHNNKSQPLQSHKYNSRKMCQAMCLEGLCIPYKSFPETDAASRPGDWIYQSCKGYIKPVARYPGYPGMVRTPMPPFVGNWRWYAQNQPGKGGGIKESGGRIGKLDAANEDGIFHNLNKSRLEEIKRMLKNKSLLKGSETPPTKK